MGSRRLRRATTINVLLLLILAALAPASNAAKGGNGKGNGGGRPPSPAVLTPPWQEPSMHGFCSPEGSCEHDALALDDGYLEAFAYIPAGGTERRSGTSVASLVGTYNLTRPVSSLTIEVLGTADGRAEATLGSTGDISLSRIRSLASHDACPDCEAEAIVELASNESCQLSGCPGEAPYTLTIEMTSPTGSVPAGTIWIRTLLGSFVLTEGPGEAVAHGVAFLDEIRVTPHP